MDNFNEIQNLITEDKVRYVDDSFYLKIKKKLVEGCQRDCLVFKIRKLHISYGVAAGILIGVFVGGIIQRQIKSNNRKSMVEDVLDACCLNEMQYEFFDYDILQEF